MAKKQSNSISVYQMKITLVDIHPPIWRRFLATSNQTLEKLHLTLQTIIGWQNRHFYEFIVDGRTYGEPDEEYGFERIHARLTELSQVIKNEKQTFIYAYDFGDDWQHEILVEKILPVKANVQYPVCLAGERSCPPEDCGGVSGYEELLGIIQNPDHEEYEDTLSWLGGKFDPEAFNVRNINRELKQHRERELRLPLRKLTSSRSLIDTYPMINRGVAIIKPQNPFFQWLISVSDKDFPLLTLEEMKDDCTSILIPEFVRREDAIKYIEYMHKEIFEMELDSWVRDKKLWPKKRTIEMFREWFDVEIHSMVIDSLDEKIE